MGLMLTGSTYAAPFAFCPAVTDTSGKPTLLALGDASNPRLLETSSFVQTPTLTADDKLMLKQFSDQFKAEGINLVMIPIPSPALVYGGPAVNPKGFDSALAVQQYADTLAAEQAAGLNVIDVLPIAKKYEASGGVFFALRDHHWTGEGMQLAAKPLVDLVNALHVDLDRTYTTTLHSRQAAYNGAYDNVLIKLCGAQPYPVEQRTFFSADVTGESLLGNANTDTVIIGDSFGIPFFGFPAVVSDALKTPVVSAAVNGGGSISGFTQYFDNLKLEEKPKLVIWVGSNIVLNGPNIREYRATVEAALHPSAPLAQKNALTTDKPSVFVFDPSNQQAQQYFQLQVSGPKAERATAVFTYSDNTQETRAFYQREDAPQTTYNATFSYLLPPAKKLVSVSVSTVSGLTATVALHPFMR
ncbi:hypothetical protein GCM10008957_11570 [Deinococcus ruber]|uniref:AlgX/AlgJ SGNH hydrolase-like domain-containing protein n=2 Tax=Deinococcus ruber TaxID=1848197 RepID=A0A918BZR2_9DEIO|nr:hypothetical protein GCM10008957_11570 [Deinococcus ruber]